MNNSPWTFIICTAVIVLSNIITFWFSRKIDRIVKQRLDAQTQRIDNLEKWFREGL